MKTRRNIITAGALLILAATATLAGTETAAQVAAETPESGITETLRVIVNFLPWPWNAIAGGLLTAGSALVMWKTRRAGKGVEEQKNTPPNEA